MLYITISSAFRSYPDSVSYFKVPTTVGDIDNCFLIILNKTNIPKDGALELFIFLFSMLFILVYDPSLIPEVALL